MKGRFWAILPTLVVMASAFAGPDKESLLFATKGANTLKAAKSIAKPYGTIRQMPHMVYELILKPGISADKVLANLKKNPKIRFAFDSEVQEVDTTSYQSVHEYIEFLEARNRMVKEILPNAELEADYWEALEQYLEDRVGPDGKVDVEAYRAAVEHRDAMPAAHINNSVGGGANPPVSPWSHVGPVDLNVPYRRYYGVKPLTGRINAIAVHPSLPNTIYIGAAGGGVHKSNDGGVSWSPRSDNWEFMQVSSLAIDPTDGNVVYAGTGDFQGSGPYSMGIMKSSNGGATWVNQGRPQFGNNAVSRILIDPANHLIVTAYTGRGSAGTGRIWRSTDGGATWAAPASAPVASWSDASISGVGIGGVRTYWATGSGGVYKSTNQGATWAAVTMPGGSTGGSTSIAASKLSLNTAYFLSTTLNKIYKTTNAGSSWTDITGNHPRDLDPNDSYNWSQDGYDFYIGCSTVNVNNTNRDLVITGLITVAWNIDGDATWGDMGLTYQSNALWHNDQHTYTVDPSNSNRWFLGGDGGIARATFNNAAPSFSITPLNRNLYITQFYKIDVHPTDSSWIQGGTQDNAAPHSLGNLSSWGNPGQGDGGWVGFRDSAPATQFNSSQRSGSAGNRFINVARTTNSWSTAADLSFNTSPDTVKFIPPVVTGTLGNDNLIFAGGQRLFRWNGAWSAITGNLGDVLNEIESCSSHSGRVYTGAANGDVYRVDVGVATVKIDSPAANALPNLPIGAISARDGVSSDILVGLMTTSGSSLYRCANTTASPVAWTNVSGVGATSLPDVPVNAIARDPFNASTWYVGTDVGVFMTGNGGSTWYNATNPLGLPNVQVNDLKVEDYNGVTYLYAGTWGRGIWRIRLTSLQANVLNVIPTTLNGGTVGSAYLTLTGTAPSTVYASLSSSNTSAATVPASLPINGGTYYSYFNVTSKPVAADTLVTITGSYGGVSKTDTVTVRSPRVLTFIMSPNTVEGGTNSTGLVRLNGVAPAGGTTVNITDDSSSITPPSSIVIGAGLSTGTFTATTFPVSTGSTRILTAQTVDTPVRATLTLTPGGLVAFRVSPNPVVGGNDATGLVQITGPLNSDAPVALTSDRPEVKVPASVSVLAGQTQVTFPIPTAKVAASLVATLTAKRGDTTRVVKLTVNP